MPRIEIIPADWDESSGDASPMFDVCRSCADELKEGDGVLGPDHTPVTDLLRKTGYVGGRIGSDDVDHPCYNHLYDKCFVCGEGLDAEKD